MIEENKFQSMTWFSREVYQTALEYASSDITTVECNVSCTHNWSTLAPTADLWNKNVYRLFNFRIDP